MTEQTNNWNGTLWGQAERNKDGTVKVVDGGQIIDQNRMAGIFRGPDGEQKLRIEATRDHHKWLLTVRDHTKDRGKRHSKTLYEGALYVYHSSNDNAPVYNGVLRSTTDDKECVISVWLQNHEVRGTYYNFGPTIRKVQPINGVPTV